MGVRARVGAGCEEAVNIECECCYVDVEEPAECCLQLSLGLLVLPLIFPELQVQIVNDDQICIFRSHQLVVPAGQT